MSEKIPQYLSAPFQILWFEMDEVIQGMFGFVLGATCGGFFWLLVLIMPIGYRQMKKRYPTGFLKHMIYMCGIKQLKHYPGAFEKKFFE